jgi:glutamate N-acetyltransferase / amino-acid N-acetyltransferase
VWPRPASSASRSRWSASRRHQRSAAAALGDSADHDSAAAESITTTDTFAKEAAFSVSVDTTVYTVGGMAKGSGMIMPDMATMLGFLTTDAPLTPEACRVALALAADRDVQPHHRRRRHLDQRHVRAHGERCGGRRADLAGHPRFPVVAAAVREVCAALARMIVRDGEGATKLVSVTVTGAADDADAEAAARAVANSPLFKTALFGRDANWGRVAMAIGNSAARIDPAAVEITFAGILTCAGGTAVPFSEEDASAALSRGRGRGRGRSAPRPGLGDGTDVRPDLRVRAYQRRVPHVSGADGRT